MGEKRPLSGESVDIRCLDSRYPYALKWSARKVSMEMRITGVGALRESGFPIRPADDHSEQPSAGTLETPETQ